MEFVHDTLSSVLFHVCKFCLSFWEANSQPFSWLNKKEIPRTQKQQSRYTTCLCHATFNHSANTTPFTDDNHQRQPYVTVYWGHSSFLLEFTVKLRNYTATNAAEAVYQEWWQHGWGEVPVGEGQLRQSPSQLPPLRWRLLPWPGRSQAPQHRLKPELSLHRCGHILGGSELSDLYVSTFQSDNKFPQINLCKLININCLCLEFLYIQTVQPGAECHVINICWWTKSDSHFFITSLLFKIKHITDYKYKTGFASKTILPRLLNK